MEDNVILELKNITAGYDSIPVLLNASLQIRPNDFIGIIGPNGGGKTTLLKVILGLLHPFQGEVIHHGNTNNMFGYLPQNNPIDLQFPISVLEVILSGLMSEKKLFGKYRKEDTQRCLDLLERYNMLQYQDASIGELSGGQRQRIFLFRAIISSPQILILDEPTTFVDSNFEKEFYTILSDLNKTMSIVMVSHDLGTICTYVKSIACVNKKLHYHNSNLITPQQLEAYNCPIELITHGKVPHRVLTSHNKEND